MKRIKCKGVLDVINLYYGLPCLRDVYLYGEDNIPTEVEDKYELQEYFNNFI